MHQELLEGRYKIISSISKNDSTGKSAFRGIDIKSKTKIIVKRFDFRTKESRWKHYKEIENEISILQSLNHSQIPRYLASFSRDKSFYLIQQFIDAAELSTQKNYLEEEIIEIAIQLLNILIYLQSLNPPIVHHDIKPQNILIDDQNRIYLIDFGIAQNNKGSTLSFTSQFSGTEGFIAPEKFLGRKANSQSDLYSLGMTIACMISQTPQCKAIKLLNNDFELCSSFALGYSLELINWVLKLTRRKPEERFNNPVEAKSSLINREIKSIKTADKSKNTAKNITPSFSNLVPGKLLVDGNRKIFEFFDPMKNRTIRYLVCMDKAKSNDNVWAVKFVKSNQYMPEAQLIFFRAIIKDIDFTLGVTEIYREYNYEAQLSEYINCNNQNLKQFNLNIKSKLVEQQINDIIWFLDKGQIIDYIDERYKLIKIYSNLSLKPTKPIHILIDFNLSRSLWTVPPRITSIENAIRWRSFKKTSIKYLYSKFIREIKAQKKWRLTI